MKKKRVEKLIEAIRKNMSMESVVCDSVMRCQGWGRAQKEGQVRYWIESNKKINFCPYCGKKITWDIEP